MAIACTVLLLLVPMDCGFEQALANGAAAAATRCADSDDFDPVRQGDSEEVQEIRNILVRRVR